MPILPTSCSGLAMRMSSARSSEARSCARGRRSRRSCARCAYPSPCRGFHGAASRLIVSWRESRSSPVDRCRSECVLSSRAPPPSARDVRAAREPLLEAPADERVGGGDQQLVRREGLHDVAEGALFEGHGGDGRIVDARGHHDGRARMTGEHLAARSSPLSPGMFTSATSSSNAPPRAGGAPRRARGERAVCALAPAPGSPRGASARRRPPRARARAAASLRGNAGRACQVPGNRAVRVTHPPIGVTCAAARCRCRSYRA